MADDDEQLAYGENNQKGTSDRGFVSDTFQKLQKSDGIASFLDKVSGTVQELRGEFLSGKPVVHGHHGQHRFDSFVGPREGNGVKWYVDGAGYFYAVSLALEQAQESIWILDWWLSPELYLRRPPAKNEQYRLDRMLQRAAERGVKISIIVYKEVAQALTLNSEYTKHYLESLHPNIAVFRHPDHTPDAQTLQSSFISSLQGLSLNAATAAKLPGDALKALYGMSDDIVLYWAHHEKLCLTDGRLAFMGGLDLCYGRWDTNQHSIADAHPVDLEKIIFPGQDFNNARIMDFEDVQNWQQNKLDRKHSSRMGWSDVSISLHGPVVEDLRTHFVQRWNFIWSEKYDVRKDVRYQRLSLDDSNQIDTRAIHAPRSQGDYKNHPIEPSSQVSAQPGTHAGSYREQARYMQRFEQEGEHLRARLERQMHRVEEEYLQLPRHFQGHLQGRMSCQLVRSASKWSHGIDTEHSIANAYATLIRQASHFIYIENQFFITATGTKQSPIKNNLIGSAIVERILRAARTNQKFKVVVIMPAIPAFAGDLKDDASLGTRAIMEYQYNSINRGGHSILQQIADAGFDPLDYIRFFNLRNYDRINTSAVMRRAEEQSGVDYEDARRAFDKQAGGYEGSVEATQYNDPKVSDYNKYQRAATSLPEDSSISRWDTVTDCLMLNGPDIRKLPWSDGDTPEIEAFVTEELYVHTKVMIVDDRIAICGSANLNDRSQLGYHDSEIALVIEDSEPLDSWMDGRPFKANRFAATLRRQLVRKHLGLIQSQNYEHPNANFVPVGVPNNYDYASAEDALVTDPLAENFLNFWNARARTNTEAFRKVFHPVPDDNVRTWKDYDRFYEQFFREADEIASGKKKPGSSKYRWGHVISENFSPGAAGVEEMKTVLSTIKGTLVEMPLLFLIDEDIAKEGLSLNSLTEEVYT